MSDFCPWVQNKTPEISWKFHIHLLLFAVQNISTKETINKSGGCVKITVNMSYYCLWVQNKTLEISWNILYSC
jgi:hypothetical protein